jgi:hypothetical protein
MAIPAFQKVRQNSSEMTCHNNRLQLSGALEQYLLQYDKTPETFSQVAGPGKIIAAMPVCSEGGSYSANRNDDAFEVIRSVHGAEAPAAFLRH